MTDLADRASDEEEATRAAAIDNARRMQRDGARFCDNCGEPVSDLRRQMGARRCLDCQVAFEHATEGVRRF